MTESEKWRRLLDEFETDVRVLCEAAERMARVAEAFADSPLLDDLDADERHDFAQDVRRNAAILRRSCDEFLQRIEAAAARMPLQTMRDTVLCGTARVVYASEQVGDRMEAAAAIIEGMAQ